MVDQYNIRKDITDTISRKSGISYVEEVKLLIRSADASSEKQNIPLHPRDRERGEFETDTGTAHFVSIV
jgi:hypothetical protein